MRIAIMGSGGMGGYWGGLLAQAGTDVTFIARGAHLEALRTQGLTIQSRVTGDFTCAVSATDDPRTIGPVSACAGACASRSCESSLRAYSC